MGLAERHPELFEKAVAYEKHDGQSGIGFTWQAEESLVQLKARLKGLVHAAKVPPKTTLLEILQDEDEDEDEACLVCSL